MHRNRPPHILHSFGVTMLTGLALAGCTSATTGNASPASDDVGAPPTTAGRVVSDDWWKSANVCGLLDQAAASHLGFPNPGRPDINSAAQNSCDWDSGNGQNAGIVLTGQRYNDLSANGGQLSNVSINGRPGEQDAGSGGNGSCDLALQATDGSRALIIATVIPGTADQACQLAQGVAHAIEPKLPRLTQ